MTDLAAALGSRTRLMNSLKSIALTLAAALPMASAGAEGATSDGETGGPCIEHILVTGQSLAAGQGPVLTETPVPGAFMFPAGLFASRIPETSPLVPLAESERESPASGIASMLVGHRARVRTAAASRSRGRRSRDARVGRLVAPGEQARCAGSGPSATTRLLTISSRGGTRLAELDRAGGDPFGVYGKAIDQIESASAEAKRRGTSYALSAVVFIQGEADRFDATDDYLERLRGLQDSYEEDSRLVSRRQGTLPFITYQTSSTAALGDDYQSHSRVPLYQLEAQRLDDDIFLAAPTYQLPYLDSGHPTNEGSRWMGEQLGKVYDLVVNQKVRWAPVMPLRISQVDDTVHVEFHVPCPPLVLDSEILPDAGDYGFSLRTADGERIEIESVRLAGPTAVDVVAADPVPPGSRLLYAREMSTALPPFEGGFGNLRDSDANVSPSENPLFNFAVIFDEKIGFVAPSSSWRSTTLVPLKCGGGRSR